MRKHQEHHRSNRIGWLRAAVLGANDGIVSTASLIVGVAAANTGKAGVLVSGVAGLVAGAMSMAAGEYVSVSSQADTERADLEREREELKANPVHEQEELTQIYISRGLERELASEVSKKLMEYDALKSHARDELGLTETGTARPMQAAITSAVTFSLGAALPLLVVTVAPIDSLSYSVAIVSLISLIGLGLVAARTGGANLLQGALRVGFWGAFAMAATALIGKLFGSMPG